MYFFKKKLLLIVYIFLFIICSANATTKAPYDNIVVNEKPIIYKEITFEDFEGNIINLKDYKSMIYVLNFWATWCTPCKKEMPSLDKLDKIEGIKVFPINLEKKNQSKTQKFYNELKIKNLSIFFDPKLNLIKLFNLRGVPTTLLLNSKGEEFARVIGSIDFSNVEFINWILSVKN